MIVSTWRKKYFISRNVELKVWLEDEDDFQSKSSEHVGSEKEKVVVVIQKVKWIIKVAKLI